MRVLFVISDLGWGGAERQLVVLSRELARLGHEVSIYTSTCSPVERRALTSLRGPASK